MPAEIVTRLNAEMRKALTEPQAREKLEAQDLTVIADTPEAVRRPSEGRHRAVRRDRRHGNSAMEHRIASLPRPSLPPRTRPQVSWRDLREWIALIERNGELQRIGKPVDADEELAAITYMATRSEKAPALLFENIAGDRSGSRVLANMLGSSKERYALAVGLDPDLSIAEMIAESRTIMNRRIAPVRIPKSKAPVNEIVLRGDDIDLTQFPAPKFWPGDGGRYIGTGDITLTASPDTGRINVGCYRQMLHGPRRVGLYCSPGKHGGLDREAWWKQRQALRGRRRLRRRSGAVHAGGAGVRRQGIRARRRRRHDGPRHRADRRRVRQPADPGARRARHRRRAARGRRRCRRARSASSPAITAASARRSR